ncbi:MAG: cytochrome ubiquinol oxidase subunit I [Phycisphaeraceae bacterium]|nr:cytochrome ubiquinol oxidase subunit I [Phycisphaeraceae bacterium]
MDVDLLSRALFATTIMFHYLFPPLTIGLSVVMVVIFWKRLRTRDPAYDSAAKFWTGLFALNFGMGVATGIPMEFQFGTNWSVYARFVGDIFGSALAAEGIFAFFLESGFLGVLVFGWNRVSARTHFIASVLVCIGSVFSATWIVIANSWQQTPAGFVLVDHNGETRAQLASFYDVVFNPSSMERLAHVLVGALVMGSSFVLSVSAWYLLKNRHTEVARRSFRIGLVVAVIGSVLALITGDISARVVVKHQPAKLAAMEGIFKTGPAGLHLFGIIDSEAETVRYSVAIPGGLSFLAHGSFDAPVTGLDQFKPEDRPPVAIPFYAFHLMVALGMFFLALNFGACYFWWRGTLFNQRWLLRTYVVAVAGAYVANQAGWVTAEVGRQPWVVYGLLRTADANSPSVKAPEVLASLIAFGLVYFMLGSLFVFLLNHKIQAGPSPIAAPGVDEARSLVEAAADRKDPLSRSASDENKG